MSYKTYELHKEKRWALMVDFEDDPLKYGHLVFLGKYCWLNATSNEPEVRTFKTRKLARQAKASLHRHRNEAQIVKVYMYIEQGK